MGTAQAWIEQWQGRIAEDYPTLPPDWHRSLAQWLVGENPEHLDHVDEERRKIAWNSAEFCYNILRQRYLNVSPDKAYRRLIRRLGNLVLLRNKIRT